MSNLCSETAGKFLRDHWLAIYGDLWSADARETKVVSSSGGDLSFHVIHSAQLQGWYDSPAGRKRYSTPKCFFCDRHDEYNQLTAVCNFEHLVIYQSIKFCGPAHYLIAPEEHREQISAPDVRTLERLSATTRLSVFGNLRGSGASYPAHLHFQSLDAEFPAAGRNLSRVIFSQGGVRLTMLEYPVLLLRFDAESERDWLLVDRLIARIPGTFNPLWWRKSIYVIPRAKSIPFNTWGNKFAAAEVFGRIYCRSRQFFDALDFQTVLDALLDVCIPAEGAVGRRFIDEMECAAAKVSDEIQDSQRG
jgi:hypothetical protein